MLFSNYRFKSHWQVKGKINQVFEILSNFADFPNWWPASFLDLKILKEGNSEQIGQIIELKTKAYSPYNLDCIVKITKSLKSQMLACQFWGILNGSGNCSLKARGEIVDIFFDWKINPNLSIFYLFNFLLKPILKFDYDWAMQKGKQSLELELARRQAKTQKELQKIPKPPLPSNPIPFALACVGAIGVVGFLLKNRLKK